MAEREVLLHVEHLVKHFPIKKGIIFQRAAGAVHAVDRGVRPAVWVDL